MVLYWYNRDEVSRMMNEFIDEDLQVARSEREAEIFASLARLASQNDGGYLVRLRHMVRSWSRPKDYSRYQYSVGIYVPEQGSVEETVSLAQDFAVQIRPMLAAFGLKPLQDLDLDNIEESFRLPGFDEVADVQP